MSEQTKQSTEKIYYDPISVTQRTSAWTLPRDKKQER